MIYIFLANSAFDQRYYIEFLEFHMNGFCAPESELGIDPRLSKPMEENDLVWLISLWNKKMKQYSRDVASRIVLRKGRRVSACSFEDFVIYEFVLNILFNFSVKEKHRQKTCCAYVRR